MPVDHLPLVVEDANMTNTAVCKDLIKCDKITVRKVFVVRVLLIKMI